MRSSPTRSVRLPDRFYLPRSDSEGREVRDVMPWEGAVGYATDGKRLGVEYPDGTVVWMGRAAPRDISVDSEGTPAPELEASGARGFADDFDGVNLADLVSGIRSYMELHPVLHTVWRGDVAELESLLRNPVDTAGS
jgi:hypothetical protein